LTDRWNRLHPASEPRQPYIAKILDGVQGPIIAVSDFVKAVPDMIRPWVRQDFITLGTDGFGRSDTREALRRFFEVDAESIAVAGLYALLKAGKVQAAEVASAIESLGIDPDKADPLNT